MSTKPQIVVKDLGRQPYAEMWQRMKDFVIDRDPSLPGEIWLTEHPPVFTLGSNAKPEHVLAAGDIPVIPVDRGGQVTYHGPGQLMIYPLIYLPNTELGVRDLVTGLENAIVDTLAAHQIEAYPRRDAPGVYVEEKKIASIGLRIKRQWCYHGMAFNVNMDIEPFSRINPCGFAGMEITDFAKLGGLDSLSAVKPQFIPHLLRHLGYDSVPLEDQAVVR